MNIQMKNMIMMVQTSADIRLMYAEMMSRWQHLPAAPRRVKSMNIYYGLVSGDKIQ